MERRAATRSARLRTKKSPVRISPARSSPARKSPARKSPAKRSPSRKSPINKSPSKKSPEKTQKEKTNENKSDAGMKHLKVQLGKNILFPHNVNTKASTDTLNIGTLSPKKHMKPGHQEDLTTDTEIENIILYPEMNRRSTSVTKLTPFRSTPTPSVTATTEMSRQSRSMSHSDSDEDEEEDGTGYINNFKTKSIDYLKSRPTQSLREYGGAIGACILLILIPALSYYLAWCCDKISSACGFKNVMLSVPDKKTFEKVFGLNTIGAYFLYNSAIFILSSVMPLGRTVRPPMGGRNTITFYFNALTVSIIATISFIVAEIFKYPVADFIIQNYLKFLLLNILSAFVMAVWCYYRPQFTTESKWNSYARTGNFLIDFALGREINPKLFKLIDIKLLYYRASLINTLILIEVLIYKNFQFSKITTPEISLTTVEFVKQYYENIKFTDLSALLSAALVLIYILDSIVFEHHMATSFELQQEGVGALLFLRYAVTPFLLASVPKYALERKPLILPLWYTVCTLIIFVLGLVLKRASNAIKYRFRMDPYQLEWHKVQTISTFQGKRLVMGKLWGRVRQPNYTGDILLLLALTMPLYGKFAWPPLISVLLIVVYLIHRAIRINARNFARYNSPWTRYCSQVRYMIIPKVF